MESKMRSLVLLLFSGLCLAGAAGVFAQALYKSTMPDGKVIYGEKPAPGATKVETVSPPPPKTGTVIISPEEKKRAEEREKKRAAETAKAESELEEARKQLRDAEAARDAGKEALPGERIGTVGGASRLTDAYWERQKKLEEAVEAARKRLDEAQRAGR